MKSNDDETITHIRRVREALVDPTVSHPLYQLFLEFLHNYSDHPHYLRFAQTMASLLNSIGDVLSSGATKDICETGELCPISWFLRDRGFHVAEVLADLRYPSETADESYDLVFSLEVIEHIKDQRERDIDELTLFNASGVRTYAQELYRILRPGGFLVLSTPNPNSLIALRRLIDFEPTMVFRGHVREYTKSELIKIFKRLELINYDCFYSYFLPFDGEQIAEDLSASIGWKSAHRGDCQFLLFRKPQIASRPVAAAPATTGIAEVRSGAPVGGQLANSRHHEIGALDDLDIHPLPREQLLGHLRAREQYVVETTAIEGRGSLEMRRYVLSAEKYRGSDVSLSLRVCRADPVAPEVVLSIPGGYGTISDDGLWWLAEHFGNNHAAIDWVGRGQSPIHEDLICRYDPIFMETDDLRDSFMFHNLSAIWAALDWMFYTGLRPVDVAGGSWGGVLSLLLAALDTRVERVFSTFGCGGFSLPGIEKRSMWDAAFEHMGATRTRAWCAAFDPLLRIGGSAAEIYYETATNDKFFSLDMAMATWRQVRNPMFLGILPNQDHDMQPFSSQPYIVQRLGIDDIARCRTITMQDVVWESDSQEVVCTGCDVPDRYTLSLQSSEQAYPHGNMSREWHEHRPTFDFDQAAHFALAKSHHAAETLYFASGRVIAANGATLHAATPVSTALWASDDRRMSPARAYGVLADARGNDPITAPIGDKCHPAIAPSSAGWSVRFVAGLPRARATRFGICPWRLPANWDRIEVAFAEPLGAAIDGLDLVLSRRYQRLDEEAVFHPFRAAAEIDTSAGYLYRFARGSFGPGIIVEQRFRSHALPNTSEILCDFDAIGIVNLDGQLTQTLVLSSIAIF
jgi:SAM-dependent methyltransferase